MIISKLRWKKYHLFQIILTLYIGEHCLGVIGGYVKKPMYVEK